MRFFTKKIGENTNKSIFKALFRTASIFVVGYKANYTKNAVFPVSLNKLSYLPRVGLVVLLLSCIGGVGIQVAFSEINASEEPYSVKSTLLVYPASVFNVRWGGVDHVLTPDLSEDAIYQKFSAKNSAFVPLHEVIIDDSTIDTSPNFDSHNQTDDTDVDTNTTEAQDENQSQTQSDPGDATDSIPVENDVQSEELQESEEQAEPISLKKATASVFTFLETVSKLFPFTQETLVVEVLSTDTELDQDVVVQSEPNVLIDDVSSGLTDPSDTTETVLSGDISSASVTASSSENTTDDTNDVEEQTADIVEVPSNDTPELPSPFVTRTLSLSDFSIPELKPGEFIESTQLRVSLGAKYKKKDAEVLPTIVITYKTPSSTHEVGTIILTDEISNALNGGYFLFALPEIVTPQELAHIEIDVTYVGDTEDLDGLFLDAVWLEIGVEKIDRELLEEKALEDTQERLEDPKMSTLLSSVVDFPRDEVPYFSLKYNPQRNFAIRFIRDLFGSTLASVEQIAFVHDDVGDIGITPDVSVTEDGLITISVDPKDVAKLKPGVYSIEFEVNEGGKTYRDSFEFQYGLLSINTNKTAYTPNSDVHISMGALSPNGNTICDAQLELYIIAPQNVVSRVPVHNSDLCNGNNVIDVPDYTALFVPNATGTYQMYLERMGADGTVLAHTSDTFEVTDRLPLSLERKGPSRIYPRATYPMEITVIGQNTWEGVLVERVPKDFIISSTSATIIETRDAQELRFDISLTASSSQTVSYSFDAPDISPFLYSVGKARLEGESLIPLPEVDETASSSEVIIDPDIVIDEAVSTTSVDAQQIPVTTSTTREVLIQNTVPSPELDVIDIQQPDVVTKEEETLPEDNAEEKTLFEKIIDMLPFVGNDDAVTPQVEQSVETESTTLLEPSAMDQVVASQIEDTVTSSTTNQTQSVVFEEHRQWQIASDATGSMIVYWTDGASIPSGWTCLSCGSGTFYQKFVRGGATYNSTGGAATHTHNASGTVNSSATANSENRVGVNVAVSSHSHTYTPTITASTTLPAYRNMRVIQNNSAGEPASLPAGVILLFDGTLPSGWARYTALDARYPRGENALLSVGSSSHRHTISGSTAAASGSTVDGRAGGVQVTASANTHTHTVSSNTGIINHEPPYISVIFATSSSATGTPTNALALWTDTPPAQWQNQSATTSDPFYEKFIKGSATYGTTGGSLTHTHLAVTGITSSAAVNTQNARTGATGASSVHTHLVDATNFTTTNHLPPYVTAIFGKKYGAVPLYTQTSYKWFVNTNAITPTDAWPVGAENLLENEAIDSARVPVKSGDIVRMRVQLSVSNSTSTADTLKLQFASTTSTCGVASTWTDVGNATSSALWRGYNNASVADGATLSSSTLSGTDQFETYEETNPTASTPNTISTSQQGEWDFVLQQNGAYEGATYCFRMVKSNGTALFSYTQYPTLVTNEAPNTPTLAKLFDNEKVGTTTPNFEFSGSDAESNDLTYQIQVDDDYAFGSANIDRNSVTNSAQFENATTPADKDPFTQGETITFDNTTALTNGTTYYWRVRAKDPTGSNTYGSWSTIYSFTIDTTVTLSVWHQTTEEQFDTNAYTDVEAVPSDQVQLRTGSTTGTMYSSQISFSDAQVGTAWGSFAFSDTETLSDLKYTVQYDNSGVWTDIPDSVLAGNVAGFDTSPVSLLTVDKTLYPEIRIEANFVNSGLSPSLQDWTITWGYLIETPTITMPFANEKVSTTTPTFRFTTTDPQGDSLQYQIQWSTTYAFTASTTRNSNINAGFTNLTTPADTDPFNSGNNIQFKMQAGDALTNGTTYWWRVKARDPSGSNAYSFFTNPRSFTVDTSVTVSTWFQTTQSQFSLDTLSNGYARATDVVTVATTTQNSLIVYGEGNITTPRYRTWNGTVWSSEASALDVGATIPWVVTKASPIESEYVTATMGTDADVNVQVYANGAWGNLQEVTASIANTAMRGFDVTYETTSGDAMVVTCDGDSNPTYYIWNGTTWTNGGAVGMTVGNTCGWIKLISDPISDEIIAIARDTSGISYEARVWTGSAWGNSTIWGSMNQANHEGIAAEYEDSGNQAVVAVSNGTASSFVWLAWNGTAWSTPAVAQTNGDDFEAGNMVRDDGTDNLALCYIDEDGDIGVQQWTGTAWVAFVAATNEIETTWTTASTLYNDQPVDCEFEVGGSRDGYITAIYSDRTNLRYRTWTGAAWVAEASISTIAVGPRVHLERTGNNLLQAIEFSTSTDSYRYSYWNGTIWSAQQTLETDASVGATPFKLPFQIAAENPSVIGTVTGDPQISFYEGSGPYWQQMSWTDTTTGGSDILYQVQYYNGSTWQLISNTLIPGNSVGTTTSPINLTNVLPASTYSIIRPVANMTCNVGVCPSLSDWTITWSAGITISGTAKQYDQSANVTSGTVAVALNGVVQVGKTGTIAAGVWSIANVNATAGDVVTVFVTGASDSAEAVVVSKYDGVGNMSGMNLFERHVSIGSDDVQTVTNANLATYDFTNTEDIFYDVNVGNDLTACATTGCNDVEIIVKALNTYQPGSGADISTRAFENNGTLKLNGNTMTLSGSWDNNATTTMATSSVVFNATSSSKTIDETGAIAPSFYNLTIGNATSTAVWTASTSLDINNNLTVTGGTLARGSLAMTIAGNVNNAINGIWTGVGTTTFDGTVASTWTDASVALQNIGRVIIDGTNKLVTLGSNVKARSIRIGSDDTFDVSPSGYSVTLFTNWINNNTFNARTGSVIFAATTTGKIITTGSSNFYNLSFTGVGGGWSFTASTLGIDNDLSITAGTVTLPTATTTIVGSFTNAGTFVHNNGQLYFTSGSAETLTLAGTAFANAFYNARFTGAGSWSFTEANATTSNLFRITQGNVTLPSGTLTVGDTFTNSAGTFTHNSGTVKFNNTGTRVIDTNSSFNSLRFTGSGSTFSFLDSSVTALGSLTVSAGTLTLPSSTLTLGGSLTNSATVTHNSGTVLFNSTDTGEFVNLGNSSLFNMTFTSGTGGWTVSEHATTTNNTTLTSASTFTLASGKRLSTGNIFTNSVGGASTTWTGSTLALEAGNYSLNAKTNAGDTYNILLIKADTDIKMWNSSASTYSVNSTGSLYSQDHTAIDGDLYIFGNYPRTSGTEYWSYATDFDGTALSTTSRQVDVKFASGASASFSNSTINVTGIATATTTIANQGSGTYLIGVSSGTTTASYYNFANLGSTGVSLTSANKVTSLANGVFSPGVGGGTTLTLSSTTVDRNPALQIQNVNFSTTSIIVATNVTQVDGTPTSYWWFRNSVGNLDGEARDFDTGDPGSVRWDDSSLSFTVAGTVYSDAGITPLVGGTCNGIATPVRVKVEGGATYDGTCSAINGSFSIPNVVAVGDPTITVFLNGASGGQKAVTVTKTPTQNIANLNLYANRVIVRHEDASAMTIADMATYDSTDDADIVFTAATGTTPLLTVFPNTELFVWATTTFTPAGTVTLRSGGTGNTYDGSLHIDNGATFTGAGTTTYSIGGSFTQDSSATFTPASSTVLMLATTSGKTVLVATGRTATFNLLRFTGVGGSWNLNGDMSSVTNIEVATGTVTGTGNISVLNGSFFGNGTLSLGSGTTTIAKTNTLGGTRAWTFSSLTLGNGSVIGTTTPASTATTTVSGKLTIATAHYLKANASRFNLSGTGNVFVESGTFLEGTSTLRYSGTASTNILSTPYYNLELKAGGGTPTYTAVGSGISVLNNLSVGGLVTTVANFNTNDPALDVNGSVSIVSNGTLIGSNSASFTVAGNWTNAGAYTSSTGTVTFDGAGSPIIDAGSSSFGSLTINGTGSYTVSQHATATAAFSLNGATAFTLASGKTLAVGGVFTNAVAGGATTWTGSTLRLYSGTNYQINAKTLSDTYNILSIAPNTDIRMWNSSAATYTVDSTGSLYSQDHNDVQGDLYMYGNYPGNGGTDYWSYATDFDGALLGGSSRQVDVRFQSGASMTLVDGGLRVLGIASASTSLQNQGSGTYGMRIGGLASTSWSYYDVQHTDSSGLTFSGTPNVVSLSRGSFTVTQAAGSAITVGGATINANAARTFTNNIFATTTAIAAFNVTATGTAVSSWRFTNHSGNIDGEARDVDPDGDPGYIVWDDSAANITISGNVYSDEGSTPSGAGVCNGILQSVTLKVAGLTTYTTTCAAGTGAYSIPGVSYSPGDSLIVYLTPVGLERGATVTEDPTSNISNLTIYENRVIVRHEGVDPLSIADMAVWSSSNDAFVPFTAVDAGTDTLTVPANRKLLVWTGKTFTPGGNVTLSGGGAGAAHDGTLEAQTNASVIFAGTQQHSIGGSFIFGTGATFTAGLSTTTFTTTGSARTIDVNNQSFYNTAFTGSGSWSVTDSNLAVRSAFITAGTLTLPTGTTTVGGSWSNTGGTFVINNSTFLFTSTASGNVVRGGGSSFEEMIFRGMGGSWSMTDTNATSTSAFTIASGTVSLPSGVFSVGGSFRNNGGTITHNTCEIVMRSATASTIKALSSSLFSLTISGAGPFTMSDGSLTLVDDFKVTTGAITLATSTLSVGGSFTVNGGTFAHASGSVLFNATAVGKTINPRLSSFYNVVFGSGSGGWTIVASATTTRNFTITTASSFAVATATRLYVGNVFTNSVGGSATTWTGSTLVLNSGSTYSLNTKSAGGDNYQNLRVGANTDISMWNSKATSTVVNSSGSLYSQDHGSSDGSLSIFGDYHISTSTAYWSYATDFDGTALGGSPRTVTVSIIGNATTTVDGGSLQMVGGAVNKTRITNQGSGTYTFTISSGTFNALYYEFRNLKSTGLSFTGSPTITSLSQGDFELAVAGGSLIRLSSTTLNANASMLITGNRFATTSAITGNNVTLLGTTSNAWTFTSHTGNIAGENYDTDGATACGSIRWTNSSCQLTQQTHYRWRNDNGTIGVPNTEWFNGAWDARQRVRVQNVDATTYTNAVVKVTVPFDGDMQTDFDDLRFTDSSGTTSLKFFTERYTASANADVWVKIPTLTANDTTTIFMYYKHATASSTSSSTQTFIAADDFEDGNKTEYSGDTSLFTVDGTFAYGGLYGIDATGQESARATDGIGRTDITVSQGQIIRYMQYVDTTAGSGDEACGMFAVQVPVTANQNYGVCLEQFGTDRISLVKNVVDTDSSGTRLASTSVTYSTGWYEVEIDWKTSNVLDVTLSKDGTVVATTSATDATHTSGGIGFTFWFQNGGWDNFTSRTRVDTEPTIRFGAEQSDGGATWKAAIDTAASYVAGDIARLRFVVENTGLQITGRTFDIEFAALGAAPSCEAVSSGSFVRMPNQASCGSSALCMQSSANVTDNGSATDLLFGPVIDFTLGKVVESPSYTTSALTLNQNAYTELEYVITPTVNATSPNYCFRVTNAGAVVDTYLQVAKLNMRFDPVVTNVSLNSGANITLLPGATTTVYVTGTATDLNGYADMTLASSTIYRSGAGASCTADTNSCYISQSSPLCAFSACAGNSCTISCRTDLYYHADATDASPYIGENWLGLIEVRDSTGAIDIESVPAGVEVLSLRALSVTNAITYGSLAVSSTSGSFNPTTTIRNLGNNPIDVNVGGTDLFDGSSSRIPAREQKYSTSTFTYTGCPSCSLLSSTTPTHLEVDLAKPTSNASPVTDIVYWGIAIPFGVASNPHSGANTFYAVAD